MVGNNQRKMYSEIYGIIESMGESYRNRIPKKMYQFICENRDENYNPKYDLTKSLANQDLSANATAFICFLHYKYWCETKEEKSKIEKILEYNEKKNKEKYDVNNIFETNKKPEYNVKEEKTQLVEYKENIFKKLIDKIKSWFGLVVRK